MKKRIPLFILSSTLLLLASCAKGNDGKTNNTSNSVNTTTGTNSTNNSSPSANTSIITQEKELEDPKDASDYEEDIISSFQIITEDGSYNVIDNTYTITQAGTYILSGNLDDGNIVVDAADAKIELALSNAKITSTKFSPICVLDADSVDVKAASDTYNEIIDERDVVTTEEYDAAIYANCDLDLKGKGYLVVESNYNGVKSKDDLEIKNLTMKVKSKQNSLKGNDSVTIENGNLILISTDGDGIKTSNSSISSKGNQKGNIDIKGGLITIYAKDDGIDSSYNVNINEEIEALSMQIFTGKESEYSNGYDSTLNSHGISSENEIIYDSGTTIINAGTDGIHANRGTALENGESGVGNVTINNGYIEISVKDDGIHADYITTINGGDVNILTSNEGIEGANVIINDGEVAVYALDDGINASTSKEISSLVKVTGGIVDILVSSGDTDGIDSNGTYQQTGGIVVSKCPTNDNSGNMAALDVDNGVNVTGGTLILVGGLAQFNSNTINYMYFTQNQGQGGMMPPGGRFGQAAASSSQYSFTQGEYTLVFDDNNQIKFTLDRTYSNMLIASNNLVIGNQYKLISPSQTYTWTQSSKATQYGQ